MRMKIYPSKASILLTQLQSHISRSEQKLHTHHPEAVSILHSHGIIPGKMRQHAARLAASGVLAGAMLLSGPMTNQVRSSDTYAKFTSIQREQILSQQLFSILPQSVDMLTANQEQRIANAIEQMWGIKAIAVLENERLNRSYGLIGAEQHLPRYPGDTIDQHGDFLQSGITPGKGAWGYFASSKDQMTLDLVEKEKYYVAVQTLYLPDWNSRLSYLHKWYKYRKVLVVNPINGKTIVCDVADSGPAEWTGKHFGGSPEVMAYLELNVGKQKGPVLLFFVDDKDNAIPLGPVKYNIRTGTSMVQD